jgi:hypothetical protein
MLSLLETFLEFLLWNSFQCRHFFGCLQHPEIFVTLRQNVFSQTARNHSEPNEGNRVGAFWAKNYMTECPVSWSIVMVENPIVGPKFRPFGIFLRTVSRNCISIST